MTELAPVREQRSGMDFRQLFHDHASYVWNSLRRLGVPESERDDLTQEVFMTVHALRENFDASRAFRPWAFGIAYRIVLRHRRARGKDAIPRDDIDIVDPAPTPQESLDAKQTQARVTAALARLEVHRRAVFIMKDIDGHSIPEIATELGIGLNTAYSRLRLAREDFAAELRRASAAMGETS